MKWTRLIFLPVLFIVLAACEEDRADALLEKANREWIDGQTQSSVELYKTVLNNFPNGPAAEEALFRLGEIFHFSLGDSNQAILYFQEVLLLNKKGSFSYEAQKHIADIVEFTIKDLDQAIIEYQNLINRFDRLQEEKEDHHFRIALIYYKKQNYEQALAELEEHLEDYPDSKWGENVEFKAVEILYTLNKCSQAQPHYDRFVSQYPQSKHRAEMDFLMASCLEEEGQLKEALEKFKALENSYPFPAMLEMKIDGLASRIKKSRKMRKSG